MPVMTENPREGTLPGTISRSVSTLRRLERAARDAKRLARELATIAGYDLFGRYTIPAEQGIDEEAVDDVVELLHRLRLEHPNQELEIIFTAHEGREEEEDHGKVVRHSREDL